MDLTTKQVFFLFFAIHLPPVEEGEFLLYIMLKKETFVFAYIPRESGYTKSNLTGKKATRT